MSHPLGVQPALAYEPPDYPGVPICPDFSRRRYAPTVLDAIRNGLSRPLVVFGLFTCLSLPVSGDEGKKDGPRVQGEAGPKDPEESGRTEIKSLDREEIARLVCGLDEVREETAHFEKGDVAGAAGYLTEEEGRALLAAYFKKNGFSIQGEAPIRDRGVEFTADGFDRERQVGFEFLGPQDPGAWEFAPVDADLDEAETRELDLAKARGGRAILVLDGRRYQYNVESMSHLPSKSQVVDRLLEDVRSFFVWLSDQGRLAAMSGVAHARSGEEEKE